MYDSDETLPPDPAYDAWVAEQEEYDETHCKAQYESKGSDPWLYTCDLLKDHDGDHSMTNPLGADTGKITWPKRRGRLTYHSNVIKDLL